MFSRFSSAPAEPADTTMPVPPEITIQNLSGTYTLNRYISDSSQDVLKMQNINFLVRQAIAYSTVLVTLQQYTSDDGKQHLDQTQDSTGGIHNFEDRIMDWEWTEKYNWIWGKVNGKSRYANVKEIEDPYLREGWDGDTVVEGYVESMTDSWTARQVWGFVEIEGVRRHARKILSMKPGSEDLRCRMVYDWKAPV